MVKVLLKAVVLTALLSLLCFNLQAQTGAGEIRGTVVDSNGAVVAGATVDVVNDNTGDKHTVTTNDAGLYVVPQIPVGVYTVTASQNGFVTTTVQSVNVSVAFTSAVNLTLTAGGGTATVTIESGDTATQVNTSDQQLSTLLDNKKILDLPLLNRDPNGLVLLAPGTVQSTSALGGFSVNGSRERNNNLLVDGADNNDAEVPGIPGGVATPNIDATQEFRVVTGSFSAELGRNTGAVVTVATKGGTNQFHGGGYMYYRSDRFAARDFFDQTGEANPLQQKQFGVSIGGPIKKDKAFFFFNYEGLRSALGAQQSRLVPTAAARTGILNTGAAFGTLDLASPVNNLFGLPFNAATLAIINRIYPLPNSTVNTVLPNAFGAYVFNYTEHNTSNTIATRIDYQLTSKHSLTGSFNFNNSLFDVGAETFPGSGDTVLTPQRGALLSLNLVSTLTPSLVNEAHFSVNRVKAVFNGTGDGGVPNTLFDQINQAFQAQGYPLATNFGGANGQRIDLLNTGITGLGGFDSQKRFAGTTVAGDSVTLVRGNHTLKFGGEFRWVYSNSDTNFSRAEALGFNYSQLANDPLVADNGGVGISPRTAAGLLINNYAGFLYGLVVQQFQSQFFNKAGQRVGSDFRGFRTREWDMYAQDQWKVRTNLTLNLGLRYERQGSPYEVNGQLSTLVNQDPSTATPAGGFTFQLVGKHSGSDLKLYDEDRNNLAPRFGFNYSPAFTHGMIARLTGGPGNMSIRGGYGVYYDRVFGNLFVNARGNPPFQEDFLDFPVTTLDSLDRPPTQTASATVPGGAGIFPTIFALPGNNMFQKKFATPYEQKWSFGFQRSFANQLLMEADYVGAKGTDELRVIDGQLSSVPRVNAIRHTAMPISGSLNTNIANGTLNDEFFQVALNLANGFSSYNSLQTRVTKRFSGTRVGNGELQVAYTWSHSIDNSADPLNAQTGERNLPRDSSGFAGGFSNPERGDSGFDSRHRLVANSTYDLPFKFSNGILNRVFGGFTLAGIFSIQSGHPYSVFGNRDSQGSGVSARADFATGGNGLDPTPLPADPRTQTGPSRTLFTNPCPADSVVTSPTVCTGPNLVGRQGFIGRSTFRGPSFNQFDASVIKSISLRENLNLKLRADFFNLFNRVNFANPDNAINNDTFGRSLVTAGNPRIIQFAARLEF
jgi:hypothetical protein